MTLATRSLAIETASPACSVALFEGEKLLAHDHRVLGRGHAERLIAMIADLPDQGRADRLLVSRGPGSFTGVRVGIAAARALGIAWKALVTGYPTLALVAAMAQEQRKAPVIVCMAGGHGEWFVQPFDTDLQPLTRAQSLRPDEAAKSAREWQAPLVAGSQASALAQHLGNHVEAIDILPDARFALAGALQAQLGAPSALYGRAPDARLPGLRLPGGAR